MVAGPRSAISNPASAGPLAKASAWFVDAIVTARGKTSRGTSVGRIDARAGLSNAPAAATTETSP